MRPDKRALADRARADRSNGLAAVAAGGKGIWHPVPVGSYEQLSISLSEMRADMARAKSKGKRIGRLLHKSPIAYMGQVNQSAARSVGDRRDRSTNESLCNLDARAIADDDFRLGACRKEFTRRP